MGTGLLYQSHGLGSGRNRRRAVGCWWRPWCSCSVHQLTVATVVCTRSRHHRTYLELMAAERESLSLGDMASDTLLQPHWRGTSVCFFMDSSNWLGVINKGTARRQVGWGAGRGWRQVVVDGCDQYTCINVWNFQRIKTIILKIHLNVLNPN